ncbi:MAG: hypothetical protein AAFY15_09950, partial [Cyanobacteria bacterium J06648_11]
AAQNRNLLTPEWRLVPHQRARAASFFEEGLAIYATRNDLGWLSPAITLALRSWLRLIAFFGALTVAENTMSAAAHPTGRKHP